MLPRTSHINDAIPSSVAELGGMGLVGSRSRCYDLCRGKQRRLSGQVLLHPRTAMLPMWWRRLRLQKCDAWRAAAPLTGSRLGFFRSIEGLLMRLDSNRLYLDVFELRMPQHTCICTTHTFIMIHLHLHARIYTYITNAYIWICNDTYPYTYINTRTHTQPIPSQTHLPVKFAPHQENVQESQFTCSGSHWVIHWDAWW